MVKTVYFDVRVLLEDSGKLEIGLLKSSPIEPPQQNPCKIAQWVPRTTAATAPDTLWVDNGPITDNGLPPPSKSGRLTPTETAGHRTVSCISISS